MFADPPADRLFIEVREPTKSGIVKPDTLIFLHGVAVDHRIWRDWISVFSPRNRLVLIDLRGFGQSSGIGGLQDWALDDFADDILAAADRVGAESFHAVGESFGGTAVLNLATRGLDRVLSATTLSAAHRGGQIERARRWRADIERDGIERWSARMMEHRFPPGSLTEADWQWFKAMQDQTQAAPLLRTADILLETDLTTRLPGIVCPVLMISADRSPFVPPEIPVEILDAVPTAELCVIPGTRHGIPFSHGRFCAEQLAGFLRRHGWLEEVEPAPPAALG